MKPSDRKLLKQLIKEEWAGAMGDYSGLGIDYGDMISPFGGGFGGGDGKGLANVFFKPFYGALKMMLGKTKELTRQVATTAKALVHGIQVAFIPWMKTRYVQIFREGHQKIRTIQNEYAADYKYVWDAFKNEDALLAAFMWKPHLFLTTLLAKQGPKKFGEILDVLTGGIGEDIYDYFLDQKDLLRRYREEHGYEIAQVRLNNLKKRLSHGNLQWFEGLDAESHEASRSSHVDEGVLIEGDGGELDDDDKLIASLFRAFLQNPNLIRAIESNSKVQEMRKKTAAAVEEELTRVIKLADSLSRARTIEDIKKLTGEKEIAGVKEIEQLEPNQRQAAVKALAQSLSKSVRMTFSQSLEKEAKILVDAGVPESHPMVKMHLKAARTVKGGT